MPIKVTPEHISRSQCSVTTRDKEWSLCRGSWGSDWNDGYHSLQQTKRNKKEMGGGSASLLARHIISRAGQECGRRAQRQTGVSHSHEGPALGPLGLSMTVLTTLKEIQE